MKLVGYTVDCSKDKGQQKNIFINTAFPEGKVAQEGKDGISPHMKNFVRAFGKARGEILLRRGNIKNNPHITNGKKPVNDSCPFSFSRCLFHLNSVTTHHEGHEEHEE